MTGLEVANFGQGSGVTPDSGKAILCSRGRPVLRQEPDRLRQRELPPLCRYRLLSEIDEFLVKRKGSAAFFGTKVHGERLLADVSHRVNSKPSRNLELASNYLGVISIKFDVFCH